LPAGPFKGLTAKRLAKHTGPTYALFETDFNVHMVRAEEKIRAQPAIDGLERLLDVAPGTPLLSVERIAFTYKDVPMELRRGYYRTDSHHYHNTLS
jgi:GntR family transcriptional regulator